MTEIDFKRIRVHGKSQNTAFEELVCQLAALEVRNDKGIFHRKGPGADGGLECYFVRAGGAETGWQAKYFDVFGDSQLSNLSDSLKTALATHPKLDRFVVCLNINLRDGRVGGEKTEAKRFDDWKKKRIAEAKKASRKLDIELWDQSAITLKLTKDDPLYSGRIAYWFDETFLASTWFNDQFARAKDDLGERYVAPSSIELPIAQALAAMARDPGLAKARQDWALRLQRTGRVADLAVRPLDPTAADLLVQAVADVTAMLGASFPRPSDQFDATGKMAILQAALKKTDAAYRRIAPKGPRATDAERTASRGLFSLTDTLRHIEGRLKDQAFSHIDTPRLLLKGEAGAGKSHLLAEFVENQLAAQRPAILILSQQLIDGDPWPQIINQLDLPGVKVQDFLGALDAAAEAAGVRALFVVDALNERKGLDLWPGRLAGFLATFDKFPHVSVVVSARTTYLDDLDLGDPSKKGLTVLEHRGFVGDAAEAYLDKRGVLRLSAPVLDPVFNNPLFLKTCCDYLISSGQDAFPKGLDGITSLADFYFTAIADQIRKRMKLSALSDAPARALDAFADACAASSDGYVPLADALALFEGFHASGGRDAESLLSQFASDGVLSIETDRTRTGELERNVRFTFERFSDHAIARRLLDSHLDVADVQGAFASGPLHEAVEKGRRHGVVEALAIQLPERVGIEICDLDAVKDDIYYFEAAVAETWLWRRPTSFTKRTLEILRLDWPTSDEPWGIYIEIASDPDNPFNADHLDGLLRPMTLTERDARWSIFLANDDLDGDGLSTLIDWARSRRARHVDHERARLAAIVLTWALTTSNRGVRDAATKGLANLLAGTPGLAAELIRKFVDVEDPYLVERLLAAVLGAVTQGAPVADAEAAAAAVWDGLFVGGAPPVHLMIRDSGLAIIEYATMRGATPSGVDLARCRPPYGSIWPLAPVSDAQMATYVETLKGGTFKDQIASSTGEYGDFLRKIIKYELTDYTPFPRADAGKKAEDLLAEWTATFKATATPEQLAALDTLSGLADEALAASKAYYQQRSPIGWLKPEGPPAAEGEDDEDVDLSTVIETVTEADLEGDAGETAPDATVEHLAALLDALSTAKALVVEAADKDALAGTMAQASAARDGAEALFEKLLTTPQRQAYRLRARPSLLGSGDKLRQPSGLAPITLEDAGRWVCKRAHDLGWTPTLFSAWENSGRVSHDLMGDSRIEAVGKKYQWIALNELVGHLADHFAICSDYETLKAYEGGWDAGLRHIDPSLLLRRTYNDGWADSAPSWWSPEAPQLPPVSVDERLAWLDSPLEAIATEAVIEVQNHKTGRRCLVLSGFYHWRSDVPGMPEKTIDRDMAWGVNCLVVRKSKSAALFNALSNKKITSNSDLPAYDDLEVKILGEYPWRGPAATTKDWILHHKYGDTPVRPTVVAYLAESSTNDNSVDETINLHLPAPWLVKALDMTFLGGEQASYGKDDQVLFFDPTVFEQGSSAAIVDAEAFEAMLAAEKLAAIWVLTGERRVLGRARTGSAYGGSRDYTVVMRKMTAGWERNEHVEAHEPEPFQLKELYASG